MSGDESTGRVEELQNRLRHYPADRYPIQHATSQFHLGTLLISAGRTEEARTALLTAAELFDPASLPVEHGKSLNALGAVLRENGELHEARAAFERAVELFQAADSRPELGAALYNLGLVDAQLDEGEDAIAALRRARSLLDPDAAPASASAVARELGALLLSSDRLDDATAMLREAAEIAGRAGDHASIGAASNLLGVTLLASNRDREALQALREAVAAHPRTVRPGEHSMAKANLALSYERLGEPARARLAAHQALAIAECPPAVAAQASEILDRLGDPPGDLGIVLALESSDAWEAIMRGELMRWVTVEPEVRRAEIAAWIAHQSASKRGTDLGAVLVGGLLELPPQPTGVLVRAIVEEVAKLDERTADHFRSQISSAMARFYVPQWMRLKDAFNRVASELGAETSWG